MIAYNSPSIDEVSYTIEALTPLHIGGEKGIKPALIDLKVERRVELKEGKYIEIPVIPGSTLKGILRHTYEEALRYRILELIPKNNKNNNVLDTLVSLAVKPLSTTIYGLKNIFNMNLKDSIEYLTKLLAREQQVVTEDILSNYFRTENIDLGELERRMEQELDNSIGEMFNNNKNINSNVLSKLAKASLLQLISFIPFVSDPVSPLFSCIPDTSLFDLPNDHGIAVKYLLNIALGRKIPLHLEVCPVCLLFGAPGRSSPLKFLDALPTNISSTALPIRTRVSIDRNTLTAKKGKLYTIEYTPPGTVFKGSIYIVKNLLHPMYREKYRDLLSVLFSIAQKKMIGGLKSTGLGLVKIEMKVENRDPDAGIIDNILDNYIHQLKVFTSGPQKELVKDIVKEKLKALGHGEKADLIVEAIDRSIEAIKVILDKLGNGGGNN